MATVASQAATPGGITLTLSSASGGGDVITMDNSNGGVWLLIVTTGTATTLTRTPAGPAPSGMTLADATVVCPATGSRWVWLSYAAWANASTGQCAISWSAVTGVTFAVLR